MGASLDLNKFKEDSVKLGVKAEFCLLYMRETTTASKHSRASSLSGLGPPKECVGMTTECVCITAASSPLPFYLCTKFLKMASFAIMCVRVCVCVYAYVCVCVCFCVCIYSCRQRA